MAGNV